MRLWFRPLNLSWDLHLRWLHVAQQKSRLEKWRREPLLCSNLRTKEQTWKWGSRARRRQIICRDVKERGDWEYLEHVFYVLRRILAFRRSVFEKRKLSIRAGAVQSVVTLQHCVCHSLTFSCRKSENCLVTPHEYSRGVGENGSHCNFGAMRIISGCETERGLSLVSVCSFWTFMYILWGT